MLKLNNLKSPKGSHRNTKRLGRGHGSGQGQQAGKGHKGQRARTGGGVRVGFEGGSMPFYMRIPKSGTFTNFNFKIDYAIVNLESISKFYSENEEVSKESLINKRILKGKEKSLPVKVLGNGILTKRLKFKNIEKFSEKAKENIQKVGGEIIS